VTASLAVILVGLLHAVYAPADLAGAAGECVTELHVASYLVGPAQYFRAPEVVPGLDFESHYGIGHAYGFSLVMGSDGLQSVMERFVLFVLVVTLAYFLSAYLVLTDWLRNPWAAFGVTLILAGAATEGLAYPMPSCLPVRHPFAFVFLFCAVRGMQSRAWCVAAGMVAGLSLFWQTDIGLFTLAAGAALYLANALFLGGRPWKLVLFAAVGPATFLALCFGLFGPRVLSVTFVERLLEPLLLYASGFGTVLMNWRGGWGWWFNLAGPGIAIASVGVLLGFGRRTPPREAVYAAAASLLGLAMLTKWVNRSLDILWALNGGLILAVAGYWAWIAWRTIAEKLADARQPRVGFTRQAVAFAALGLLLVVAVAVEVRHARPHPLLGSTSPLVRIGNRLDTFPNPINAARRPLKPKEPPIPFNAEAAAFLRDRTEASERVAVLSQFEWSALTAAARAPRFPWLPLFLVHSPVLLDRCAEELRNTDRVFVEANALPTLERMHPSAYAVLAPILATRFAPAEQSPRWTLYIRRPEFSVAPSGERPSYTRR
jgi:hypothetical protein